MKRHADNYAGELDLEDDEKRWLIVGICLNSILSPVLRIYVEEKFKKVFASLTGKRSNVTKEKVKEKLKGKHRYSLNFKAVGVEINETQIPSSSTAQKPEEKPQKDSEVKVEKVEIVSIENPVDLSKLFLQTHMAKYTGFDKSCDSSALLNIIGNFQETGSTLHEVAFMVRGHVRNRWAHCKFNEWQKPNYDNAFKLMNELVSTLNVSEETKEHTKSKLDKWKLSGMHSLGGSSKDHELAKEIGLYTRSLAEDLKRIALTTDDKYYKTIQKALDDCNRTIQNKIENLEKTMKLKFSEVEKRFNIQESRLDKVKQNADKCLCYDAHNVEIEGWKRDEIMFAETNVEATILETIASKECVLIVGEPGIEMDKNTKIYSGSPTDEDHTRKF